jgi:hypothetical protein
MKLITTVYNNIKCKIKLNRSLYFVCRNEMVLLTNIGPNVLCKIAQFLCLKEYALFTSLNRTIRRVVGGVNLDYSEVIEQFITIQESSRFNQFVGLNLQITTSELKELYPTLYTKIAILKLDLENPNFPLKIHWPMITLNYPFSQLHSLRALHLSNAQHIEILDSLQTLPSLTELKVENFLKLKFISLVVQFYSLEKIIVHNCPNITRLYASTKELQEVNILNCSQLRFFELQRVNTFIYCGKCYFETAFFIAPMTINHLFVSGATFRMNTYIPTHSLSLINCIIYELPDMPALKYLRLQNSPVDKLSFTPLLECLDVGRGTKLIDLTDLAKCKHIRSIITTGNIVRYPQLTTLTTFSSFSFADTNLTLLQHNTNLTLLELYGSKLTSLQGIEQLTQLTTLRLTECNITSLNAIQNCIYLTELKIRDINMLKDISALQGCVNLHTLELTCVPVLDVSVVALLPQLYSLQLIRCFNISMIPSLVNCTKLHTVQFNHIGMGVLSPLPMSIQHVNVSLCCNLRNIDTLKYCPNLVTLNLFKCQNFIDVDILNQCCWLELNIQDTAAGNSILAALKFIFPTDITL